MLWEVEIRPLGRDAERERVCDEFDLLTHGTRGGDLVSASSRGYLLEGNLAAPDVARFCNELLVDPLVESVKISPLGTVLDHPAFTVLLKPGVMDPVTESVLKAANDLNVPVSQVRTFRRYFSHENLPSQDCDTLVRKVLANDAIEQVVIGPLKSDHLALGQPYTFKLITVPLRSLDDAGLMKVSKDGQLALTIEEMRTIRQHFQEQDRDPTDCELESIAQTWSEHCSHKTLKGQIAYSETIDGRTRTTHYKNMLKETIFAATQTIRQRLGADDWCVSVFSDNAGVVKFDEQFHVCFKVETHNRPSAIEPYGGANTGLGGVIRDVLGTALGGKPICNTDVFCFAPPDFPPEELPPGVLHPRRVMHGVVAGVRDYGNRMGIPTVNGSVYFEERYLANPLVFCGTVGLIPVDKADKEVRAGDLIVAVGGRTGRDGIHGATFSSEGLTEQSEKISGGAVQIGNAIAEKKVLDVILQARDWGLYTAITDCGAGGFSSAVGEMGADLGARVELENCPLKYEGLSYTEIWISESQERMVLSVAPEKWEQLRKLCEAENVEAAVLGTFEATGRLKLTYHGQQVADVSMQFLHDGRPEIVRSAEWTKPTVAATSPPKPLAPTDALKAILGSFSVCSKEWVIRQYDHEVQGGSVIKPLVGVVEDGPSDAAVVAPVLGSTTGIAVGNGLNPRYADLDPWAAAAAAIDEAVRNVVAVGGDPTRTAILDNFCWGNITDPQMLGALVRTSEACRDVALAYGTPFISGKDSLNNEYRSANRKISIPHTLLISSLAHVTDVTRCVTMDLKEAGNDLYLVGVTKDELGGSHYHVVNGATGGRPPCPDLTQAPKLFAAVHRAITSGLVRACHDLSEGGLAVAVAEMAFAGGIGADVTGLAAISTEGELSDGVKLFSESTTRFVLEAKPGSAADLKAVFDGLPFAKIGTTVADQRLRIASSAGEWLVWAKLSELKDAWQKPLRW
ncbi:phosphoribosylformylglycinamidine synthase subunit PurL [Limnoglobus roseus]|uniref:Phosphoribosylformylglycinamidine synthase subunit PurL n=1 Tax=Limnoglobus roseus TaxID=2598579 RepID=A0A5C1AKJ0_9BACT|nr:phosphoribosylformylglycinamidine synthase subunit PurL [Limnoglobus roseus]QEL18232.1 phosphoribosylformylglycinamidine synthase subunit PurL [Limnoglobus roseus]